MLVANYGDRVVSPNKSLRGTAILAEVSLAVN